MRWPGHRVEQLIDRSHCLSLLRGQEPLVVNSRRCDVIELEPELISRRVRSEGLQVRDLFASGLSQILKRFAEPRQSRVMCRVLRVHRITAVFPPTGLESDADQ